MPLVWGGALSCSPVLYRPREQWPGITKALTGSVPQPAAAREETPQRFAQAAAGIEASFDALRESLSRARVEALVVLVADRGRFFDDANVPQIHVFAGAEIWGDTAVAAAGEASRVQRLACDPATADLLIAELFDSGFDIAESHGVFRPVGAPEQGAVAALSEPVARLACSAPAVPIHLNCHEAPALRGPRVMAFGQALAAAIGRSTRRVGVLASGGMSGDPGGYLAGWIDPELDTWVLRQLESGRSARLASMFDVPSNALRGNSAELRLWLAAAAAMETTGAVGTTLSYHPLHAAAAGLGFVSWEVPPCR